jgi:sulfate/thiosulfate transport system permease protein
MIARGNATRFGLRGAALLYLGFLLLAPVGLIFYRTFEHGLGPVIDTITTHGFFHALEISLLTVAIAVPLNTVFGVACALILVRQDFRGKGLLNAAIDLPFVLSPIVIGLSLFLVYSQIGWFGDWLDAHGIQVIFSTPGIVLACIFVSLPFVVREVMPVLREVGTEQEEAASTLGANAWQTFWRVTLPSIRWGVGYGVVLTTARVLGEFGAVTIVSGSVIGSTQTLPLLVPPYYESFDFTGAYTTAIVLAMLAFAALFAMQRVGRRTDLVQTGGVAPLSKEATDPKEPV